MKYKDLFLATTALLALTACSSDSQTSGGEELPVELKLTSRLSGAQTRGTLDTDADITRLQGKQIASGETVYAWVEDNSGTAATPYINAWQLTAKGDGTLEGTKQYYPPTGNNVDVYCLHGNFAAAPSGSFPSTALTHTVMADQSTAANYAKSDLLYGSVQNQGRKEKQPVVFKHKLAKIEVKLKAGAGVTAAQLTNAATKVMVTGTLPAATYAPAKAAALEEGGSIASYGGTVTASGTAADISMYLQKDNSDGATIVVFGEAIIVPQTISAAANFFKIHISDGGDLFAKLGGTESKVFEAGKKYTYTITVNLSGITLTSSITEWTDGSGDDLNADIDS